MHRFWDMTAVILVENRRKTYPTLIWHVPFGWPLAIFRRLISCQKLDSWGYQKVYISRSYFRSARHNTGVRQTDRRADRQTDTSLSQRRAIAYNAVARKNPQRNMLVMVQNKVSRLLMAQGVFCAGMSITLKPGFRSLATLNPYPGNGGGWNDPQYGFCRKLPSKQWNETAIFVTL